MTNQEIKLTQIKTRYEAKCSKCGRDIHIGWTALFQAEGKKLYCVPCSKIIGVQLAIDKPQTEVFHPAEKPLGEQLDELSSGIQANNELLGSFGLQLSTMAGGITKLLEAKPTKPVKAKED